MEIISLSASLIPNIDFFLFRFIDAMNKQNPTATVVTNEPVEFEK